MKELRNILPIALFVVVQFAYDNFAPLRSTNWSIMYFSAQHLTFLLLSINLSYGMNFKKSIPYYALASGFGFHVIRNISKINMDYEKFMISINNYEANLLLNLYIIVTLLIVLKLWHK